jgi:myo-inositol 2-dehydrogenase/D-chiro-inositol 1-dehydrogenase
LTQLKVGLAGCGRITRLAHLKVLANDPRVRVVAVADPDPTVDSFVAGAAPAATCHRSVESMLTSTDLDALVIAVPPPRHREVAVMAFDRGLHVYLEKPIAASLDDANAIVASWRRAGTIARIGFNCRFNALYREMQSKIADGSIGKPLAVRSSLTACWPVEATWRTSPAGGGGALLELASHHLDLLRFLFGAEVAEVDGMTWSNRTDDEAAMVQCVLSNGVRAQTLICYGTVEEDRFEVYGSDGKLVIDRYNSLVVERVPLRASGGIAASLSRLRRELVAVPYGLAKRRAPGQEPSFAASLGSFISAVSAGRPGEPSLDDGLAALHAVDAARRAASAR